MYASFERNINSYYQTGIDFIDKDYWSEVPFE